MKKFLKSIRANIVAGFFIIIPIVVTIFIFVKLFLWIDSVLPSLLHRDLPKGIGAAAIFLFAYLVGLLTKNYVGHRVISVANQLISSIPGLNKIYLAIQQVLEAVASNKKNLFGKTVLVEFPRHGIWRLGFITSDKNDVVSDKLGKKMVNVFIPGTPNPTSGFLVFFEESEVIPLNIEMEKSLKAIMSGGMVTLESGALSPEKHHSRFHHFDWFHLVKKYRKGEIPPDPRD